MDGTDAELVLAYVTTPSEALAEAIGAALVGERLAACANVIPGMRSIYRWKGEVETAAETVLIAKTRADRMDALIARVRTLHPHETPCVVSVRLGACDPGFAAWLAALGDG